MAKIHKAEVKIFGETFTIRANEDPDYIVKIAEYVDKKMQEVTSKMTTPSPTKAAILGALNIADELFKTRELIKERVSSIIKNIDEALEKKKE
jgi:cell division protein ZapA